VEEQQGTRQSGHRANVAEQVEEDLGELVEVVENFFPLENAEHAVEQRRLLVEKRVEANLQVEVLLDAVDVYGAFLERKEVRSGLLGLSSMCASRIGRSAADWVEHWSSNCSRTILVTLKINYQDF